MIDGYVYSSNDDEEPYVLIKDDDSHWFLIPEYNKQEFESLRDKGKHDKLSQKFGQNMIDSTTKLKILKWTSK
jgi:hypothetical protein